MPLLVAELQHLEESASFAGLHETSKSSGSVVTFQISTKCRFADHAMGSWGVDSDVSGSEG